MIRHHSAIRRALVAASVLGATAVCVPSALAQGCILLRQTAPAFGTTGSTTTDVGTWSLTFTGRSSTADTHYSGTVEQVQRHIDDSYVVNRQHSITTTVGYQLTSRISLNASLPFVEASWGIPSPRTAGQSARADENARGIGDVTTLARIALFDPATTSRSWNVEVGVGMKVPTGRADATDVFPDKNGENNLERYVDISVQPGDGGWGEIADLQAYAVRGRFTGFASGTYMLNPKNTGTASRGNLVNTTAPTNLNSVTDQFVTRAGISASLPAGLTATMAWRAEGAPRYDLIGRSDGFRRPGVEMYWEPGLTLAVNRHVFSVNVPVGYYFNRFPNPYTGTAGDATFPKWVAIATYSTRFGGKPMEHHPASADEAHPFGTPADTAHGN